MATQKKKMFRKSDRCTICGQVLFSHSYPTQAEHEVAADLLGIPASVRTEKEMTAALTRMHTVSTSLQLQ